MLWCLFLLLEQGYDGELVLLLSRTEQIGYSYIWIVCFYIYMYQFLPMAVEIEHLYF